MSMEAESLMQKDSNRLKMEKAQRALISLFSTCLKRGWFGTFNLKVDVRDGILMGHEEIQQRRENY